MKTYFKMQYFIITSLLLIFVSFSMFKKTGQSKFVKNDSLITILDSSQWKGNLVNENGQFVNHEFPFQPKLLDVLRWKTERNVWS
jgi:hypothetical protein